MSELKRILGDNLSIDNLIETGDQLLAAEFLLKLADEDLAFVGFYESQIWPQDVLLKVAAIVTSDESPFYSHSYRDHMDELSIDMFTFGKGGYELAVGVALHLVSCPKCKSMYDQHKDEAQEYLLRTSEIIRSTILETIDEEMNKG